MPTFAFDPTDERTRFSIMGGTGTGASRVAISPTIGAGFGGAYAGLDPWWGTCKIFKVPEIGPPTISVFSPVGGTTISAATPISFTVSDPDANLDGILVYMKAALGAQAELIYGDHTLAPGYSTSTATAMGPSYLFSIKRDAGWIGGFTIYVVATDFVNNRTAVSASWAGPMAAVADVTPPTITFNTAGGPLAPSGTLSITVTDTGSGVDDVTIYSKRADKTYGEIVYEGSGFGPGFTASTVATTPGGFIYTIIRSTAWAANLTLTVYAKDVSQNGTSATSPVYNAPPIDTVAPVVVAVTPPTSTFVAKDGSIVFNVTDAATPPVWAYVTVLGSPNTVPELAFDGAAFTPQYAYASTVTGLTSGLQFTLVRADGFWGSILTVGILAEDALENRSQSYLGYSATAAYTGNGATGPLGGGNDGGTVGSGAPAGSTPSTGTTGGGTTVVITTTDTVPPVIRNVSPPPGTTITSSTTIRLDAYDDTGLRVVLLWATYASFPAPEMVYDGAAFTGPYASLSHVSSITGGFHFDLNRTGGWPDPPTLTGEVVDTSGNGN